MSKLMIYIKPKLEEYDVKIYFYGTDGRLIRSKEFYGIKQIVIKSQEVRISRQIFHEYLALIVETIDPRVETKEGSLLYIQG
ncbi:MAG: hypothetical protein QXE81_01140 [Desulfurococcaceae archaeon]